jgi:hypothetical protein
MLGLCLRGSSAILRQYCGAFTSQRPWQAGGRGGAQRLQVRACAEQAPAPKTFNVRKITKGWR